MAMQAIYGAGLQEGAVAPNHAGFGVASRMMPPRSDHELSSHPMLAESAASSGHSPICVRHVF